MNIDFTSRLHLILSSISAHSLFCISQILSSLTYLEGFAVLHNRPLATPANPAPPAMNSAPQPAQLGDPTASTTASASAAGTFTVHYFATAAQYTAKNTESLPAPLPLSRLFALLEERYPGIGAKVLQSCGVSLEGEYVDVEDEPQRVIQAGEEVAVIPPVSSG